MFIFVLVVVSNQRNLLRTYIFQISKNLHKSNRKNKWPKAVCCKKKEILPIWVTKEGKLIKIASLQFFSTISSFFGMSDLWTTQLPSKRMRGSLSQESSQQTTKTTTSDGGKASFALHWELAKFWELSCSTALWFVNKLVTVLCFVF